MCLRLGSPTVRRTAGVGSRLNFTAPTNSEKISALHSSGHREGGEISDGSLCWRGSVLQCVCVTVQLYWNVSVERLTGTSCQGVGPAAHSAPRSAYVTAYVCVFEENGGICASPKQRAI